MSTSESTPSSAATSKQGGFIPTKSGDPAALKMVRENLGVEEVVAMGSIEAPVASLDAGACGPREIATSAYLAADGIHVVVYSWQSCPDGDVMEIIADVAT